MGKASDILKQWGQVKSLNQDVTNRSILDAVNQYESSKGNPTKESGNKPPSASALVIPTVKTKSISAKDVPGGVQQYNRSLEYYNKAQKVLNEALWKKHPEAKQFYEKIVNSGSERMNLYKQKMPDFYLNEEEQQAAL